MRAAMNPIERPPPACFVFHSTDNPLDKSQTKGEGAEAGKCFPLPVPLCPPVTKEYGAEVSI
jgi:hypothetical protein